MGFTRNGMVRHGIGFGNAFKLALYYCKSPQCENGDSPENAVLRFDIVSSLQNGEISSLMTYRKKAHGSNVHPPDSRVAD